jgi:hypothetical protein
MVRFETTLGIPKIVLEGRLPKYKSVHTIFTSYALFYFCKTAFESYLARSELGQKPDMSGRTKKQGRQDKDGLSWHQLKPRTYRIKLKPGALGGHLEKVNTKASEEVQKFMEDVDFGRDGINIRTGRMLAAFYPPRFVGGKLTGGPDQEVAVNGLSVTLNFPGIYYADEILYGRQWHRALFANDIDERWMKEACERAIPYAKAEYDRLVRRYGEPNFMKQNANVPRPQPNRNKPRRRS